MSSSLKNCIKTFSKCRKFEDEAITTISACNTNPSELKQKVKPESRKRKRNNFISGWHSPDQC